jgi:transposase
LQDTELYQQILGLEAPWAVTAVRIDLKAKVVDVWVDHEEGVRWRCPECDASLATYDHVEERTWRHLDTCHLMTLLHAKTPRVACPQHGVKRIQLPWAEPLSRFTLLFECKTIDFLKEADVEGTTRILHLGWKEAWRIQEKAVTRGLAAKAKAVIPRLGVDEKAIAKGHDYFTLVCNLDSGTVEYVAEDRKQASLDGYFQGLSPAQLEGIEAIAMDMHEPYIQSILKHVPQAEEKIVFDRYHIMGHLGKAVDQVRRKEHKDLMTRELETLKGTRYFWLYSEENLPEKHRERFDQIKGLNLKTSRAWAIKECLRALWTYTYKASATRFWANWNGWAIRSRLTPIIQAARTIRDHLANILTYCKHKITNAMSEGLNAKIQKIKQMACGFRNRDHFKTAIFFHCGGLKLYPATHCVG